MHKEVNLHQPVVRREDSVAEEGTEIVIEDTPPEEHGKKRKKIQTLVLCTANYENHKLMAWTSCKVTLHVTPRLPQVKYHGMDVDTA